MLPFAWLVLASFAYAQDASEAYQPLVYHDAESTGIGAGKHIVFLAGDHEYRSEETCPAIARLMAKHFGFKCTVLFNLDSEGYIEPGNNNMPGLEALKTADLAFVFLRFQDFPDDQMQHFVDYLDRGGPVVGLRTSTHAFQIPKDKKFARFDTNYEGKEFEKGFGRQILGETWVSHYGKNHKMSTRHIILDSAKDHPIMRGVTDPWGQAGGYWADPMPDSVVLTHAQPLESMEKDAEPAEGKKPCPGVWTRTYKSKSGTEGRVFTTTSGCSEDILDDDFRRMIVNGAIWAVGLEDKITADAEMSLVGPYHPTTFSNLGYRLDVKPQDMAGWDTPIMDPEKPIQPAVKWGQPRPKRDRSKKNVEQGESSGVLQLKKGDHICLVGNALGERMQHHNWWETALHSQFPEMNLAVRNLCFPGDEPQERIRSLNFGSPDDHLSNANVILYFFGFNESFDGKDGVESFVSDIGKLIEETKAKRYDESKDEAPRIVFVSPIAFENTGNPNLPDGTEQNKNIELYVDALKSICGQHDVGFADVFNPTKALFEKTDAQLTLNGAHLNDAGYTAFAPILMTALFGESNAKVSFDDSIKSVVDDKNFHWWHRYRAVNGFSIYGIRGGAGQDGSGKFNNRMVMERERAILDQMTANRDERIWALARGERFKGPVSDDNTLPFYEPTTNVGIPDDPNAKRGKLGTLKYLTAEEQLEKFELAPGYEINLVASEEQFPELANPVAINFDNKGRLWVATMASYPHWKPKSKLDDKILILEDNDADGKADNCKVFADGLHQPTGFEIGDGGAYIAQQPDVLFMKDTDGDDKADHSERRLVGFDSADSHHGIAAFQWGPGGTLYFQEGTFKFSQVESPYGLSRLGEAGIWKYDTRTEKFGVHTSFTFSNPWGHIFDRWGQDFIGDASGGLSYWAAPISGHIEYPLKHPGGSHDRRVQKEVGKPKGYRFKTLYKKRIRPLAGCEIVSSSHFPDDVQGNWLVTNCIGERTVLNHKIEEKESGFWGTEAPAIVSCTDGNFRPVDVEFAPDGSLYIVDWHNALIGHLQHNLRDPSRDHSHGRIWRVTYPDRPLVKPAKIAGEPIPALLELLKVYEDRTRNRAKRELAQRDSDEVIAAVADWVKGLDATDPEFEHRQLEALWVHQMHNRINEDLLDKVLSSKDHRARAAGVRVLSFWLDQIEKPLERLKNMIGDEHPRVRLESVRALSFLEPGDDAIEVALEVLNHEMDYYLEYTLDETMRVLEQ
ncbi:PVC-type heme-binding CxxCH protein [Mariniblastus fucicola]|uniref:PVC-type heme-binding CxxCH protein n=1 Tax=Mariniblastus fucicola TaxID=980251 RepID=UPI0009467099|nr:PVC-type heme-binding CxxCH protein [Mariniblastus fucicola]